MQLSDRQESVMESTIIHSERHQMQSRALSALLGTGLLVGVLVHTWQTGLPGKLPALATLLFALIVWFVGAATPSGALCGSLIYFCFLHTRDASGHAGLVALVSVVVLTFCSTRFRRRRKESQGTGESRHGRTASQVLANLGCAALFALGGFFPGCLAALAEAAADTTASEVGRAIDGPVRLITSWQPVPPGTNGGLSLIGTLAGVVASAIVVGTAYLVHPIGQSHAAAIWLAACSGLFFDSVLGATLERSERIGNDLVNFLSTLCASLVAQLIVSNLADR